MFLLAGPNGAKGLRINRRLTQLISGDDLFEFHFIGPVNEKFRLKDARITYHGEIRDQEIIKSIVRGKDCLVCPSHSKECPR